MIALICFVLAVLALPFKSKSRLEIGAAWANKDGRGFSLRLNLLPVGEADIVVREIQPEADAEGGA